MLPLKPDKKKRWNIRIPVVLNDAVNRQLGRRTPFSRFMFTAICELLVGKPRIRQTFTRGEYRKARRFWCSERQRKELQKICRQQKRSLNDGLVSSILYLLENYEIAKTPLNKRRRRPKQKRVAELLLLAPVPGVDLRTLE